MGGRGSRQSESVPIRLPYALPAPTVYRKALSVALEGCRYIWI